MPFNAPFQEFDFSYVSRDPDVVKSHVDLYYKDNKTGLTWFVPEGFVCDGQSIPPPLWSALGHPLQGTAIRAAFVHDRYYKLGIRPKNVVDAAFYHALLEEKDDHPYLKYLGVKLFAFFAWRKHRKNEDRSTDL